MQQQQLGNHEQDREEVFNESSLADAEIDVNSSCSDGKKKGRPPL